MSYVNSSFFIFSEDKKLLIDKHKAFVGQLYSSVIFLNIEIEVFAD